jgi:leader peptidase (prepilin peptidase)/N-methyltransferase
MIQTIITLLPVAYLAAIVVPMLVIDFREHRLPNKMVLPLAAITLLSQIVLAVAYGAWATLGISLGLGFVILVLGVFMNYKQMIGMGDVKLATGLTMMLTSFTVLGAVLLMPLSLLIGFIVAVVIVAIRRKVITFALGPVIIFVFTLLITLGLVLR